MNRFSKVFVAFLILANLIVVSSIGVIVYRMIETYHIKEDETTTENSSPEKEMATTDVIPEAGTTTSDASLDDAPSVPETMPEEQPSVDFSSLTYAAIGDSITYGFCGDHSRPPFANNYPACLQAELGLQAVANYGACGCLVSRSMNPAYSSMVDTVDLIGDGTDIISVFGGINDYATYAAMGTLDSDDEYTICGALNAIARKLKNDHPDALVFFVTPLPLAESNVADVNNTEYTVRDVCNVILMIGEMWDIPVFDANLYADFNPATDSFDGCHPTESYYADEFAVKLAEFIRQNYR